MDRMLGNGVMENNRVTAGLQAMSAAQMIVTWTSMMVQIVVGTTSPRKE